MSEPTRHPTRWLPVVVFLYGTLIAAGFAFVWYPRQGMIAAPVDLNGFGELARNLAEGNGFSFNYGPTVRRAPLYPAVGSVLLWLFGSTTGGFPDAAFYRPILVFNCVLFGLTCLVVYGLARKCFGLRAALVAAAICPIVPQSLRYVGMTEVETAMGLFIALLAATSVELVARPSVRNGIAFGVSAAGATLTKPIVLLYPIALLPLAVWHWRKAKPPRRQAVRASIAAFACFGALLLPWSIRNAFVTNGEFKGISSNGPGEFLRGYVNAQPKYYLLRQDFGGSEPKTEKWDPEANRLEEQLFRSAGATYYRYTWNAAGRTVIHPPPPPGTASAIIEVERDRVEGAEMKRRLLGEPHRFVAKFLVQLATFWYVVETRVKSLLVGAIALGVLGLAAFGFLRARRVEPVVWPVVAVLAYFNAIYAAFLAFARYSMPLYPTLCVLAAAGLVTLADKVRGVSSSRS